MPFFIRGRTIEVTMQTFQRPNDSAPPAAEVTTTHSISYPTKDPRLRHRDQRGTHALGERWWSRPRAVQRTQGYPTLSAMSIPSMDMFQSLVAKPARAEVDIIFPWTHPLARPPQTTKPPTLFVLAELQSAYSSVHDFSSLFK